MDEMLNELQGIFFGEAEQLLDDLESSLMILETSGFEDDTAMEFYDDFENEFRTFFVDLKSHVNQKLLEL